MKKRLVSLALAAVMVVSLVACGKATETSTETSTSTTTSTSVETQASSGAEALQKEAKYYYSFEDTNGVTPVVQDLTQTEIWDKIKVDASKEVKTMPGVKGNALYVDGLYGYRLSDVQGVGDTYSVSFWVYAKRLATYMPTVQFGTDIAGQETGSSQHYVNITKADWDHAAFPCVWAYDQLDNALWPWWQIEEEDTHLNEWMMITLVVDPQNVAQWSGQDCIAADFYINGEAYERFDADGNKIPVCIVNNAMKPSDFFNFYLGINYWDAIFKGAFDEIYIFDKAITAADVKAIYNDANAKAPFEEPERIIEVKKDEKAIDSLGKTDLSMGFWSDWSQAYEIKDGETWEVKLKNFSDGAQSYDNYVTVFTNEFSAAHANPNDASDAHKEIAAVRADAYGWLNGNGDAKIPEESFSWNWNNWGTWSSKVMVETNVTLNITRDGDTLIVEADNVDINGTSNTCTATVKTDLTAEDPCYFLFTGEHCYIDILSVTQKGLDKNIYWSLGIDSSSIVLDDKFVGLEDLSTPWWSAFSDIYGVPVNGSTEVTVKVHAGKEVYNNFVVILQNVPSGHGVSELNPEYKEYGVFRVDNYGWGDSWETCTKEPTWVFETLAADMDNATATITVTNNGDKAEILIAVTTADGREFTQKYGDIAIDGKLFMSLGADGSAFEVLGKRVGAEDKSSGWWSDFSEVTAVLEGESSTKSFTVNAGKEVYNNFVAIITNAALGHGATADYPEYAEYAVVRVDNYGWGAGYDGYAVGEPTWVFETLAADMDNAHVVVTVTNNGDTADVLMEVTTADGRQFTQKYTNINVAH